MPRGITRSGSVKASIIGANVVNAAKEDLGTIEDVIIGTRTSVVTYAILFLPWVFGPRG
jgi:hypothetical protein